jgi:hypothetical protein
MRTLLAFAVLWISMPVAAASLRLRWTGAKERPGNLSLLPVDVTLPEGLTRRRAIQHWTRPIAGGEAAWSTLPAGTYRLVLRNDDALPPVEISEIVLAAGDDPVLQTELPPIPVAEPERQPVPIRILVPDTSSDAGSFVLSQWRWGGVHRLTATTERASGGRLLTTRVPCMPGSSVMLETGTAIGIAVLDGTCNDVLRIPLLPAAKVIARVTVPAGVRAPASASLRLAKCVTGRPEIEIPVAVQESRLRATVPAGCEEISFRAGGFVPVTIPPPLKTGETRDLGAIALSPGAAVSVQVRSARDAEPRPGVRITAVRAHELATLRRDLDFDRIAVASGVTDSSGWARLEGLPEEKVVFLLRAQNRTLPQITEPYTLKPGEEAVLDDVTLEVPSTVFVNVVIPDALRDAVQLFAAELTPAGHSHWPQMSPITGELTASGAEIADVPPGKWNARVVGRLKNGFALSAASREIEVLSGVDQQVTLTITDTLFHGRVTHRGEPVTGVINLKPLHRGRTAVANLAADGTFQVLLENPGSYTVFVQKKPEGAAATLDDPVSFEEPDREVRIELPEGRILGRVIDLTGASVKDVFVSATRQTAEPRATAGARGNADGRFVVDFLSPGQWAVTAESKNARSEPVMITAGGSDVEDVTLIVDPINEIVVRILDQNGVPIRDASVLAEFVPPRASESKVQASFTGGDGTLQFRLAPWQQMTPANLVIRTRDGRLSCALRRLDADQTVSVPAAAGELRLVAPQWTGGPHDQGWLVSSEGCAVPFYAISEPEGTGETAMVFRRLAPGRWTYVRTRQLGELSAVLTGRGASLPAIRTFTVDAGKTTRIRTQR